MILTSEIIFPFCLLPRSTEKLRTFGGYFFLSKLTMTLAKLLLGSYQLVPKIINDISYVWIYYTESWIDVQSL